MRETKRMMNAANWLVDIIENLTSEAEQMNVCITIRQINTNGHSVDFAVSITKKEKS